MSSRGMFPGMLRELVQGFKSMQRMEPGLRVAGNSNGGALDLDESISLVLTGEGPSMGSMAGMDFLKRHPFAIEARFEKVVAVSFAFPEEVVASLLPEGLRVDAYQGLGFVTVAMVWTKGLRPAVFPKFLGRDFFLAGYRVFARLDDGKRRLRGLKILRSETDRSSMVVLGNLMTGYNYRRVRVETDETGVRCLSQDGSVSLDIRFRRCGDDAGLPDGSPFPDWRTARRFAGPNAVHFQSGKGRHLHRGRGDEGQLEAAAGGGEGMEGRALSTRGFPREKPILANAFIVGEVAYRWEKGRVVKPGVGSESTREMAGDVDCREVQLAFLSGGPSFCSSSAWRLRWSGGGRTLVGSLERFAWGCCIS